MFTNTCNTYLGLSKLIFILNNNINYKNYITKHIKFILTTAFFYILILTINFL